jgi:2-isopropylmalate synthase
MTNTKSVKIYDTTLRDGAQGEGINFTVEDKLAVVGLLDGFGVAYIEAGNPSSNPKDLDFFARAAKIKLKNSRLAAFGSTRKKGVKCEDDPNVTALLSANTPAVTLFGKCWDLHATEILRVSLEENLIMIEDTVRFFVLKKKEVIFDAEHFFDGYKANPDYALKALAAAVKGGASAVALCDTNGGCFPEQINRVVDAVCKRSAAEIGIHCHNDGGLAVANSIAAVDAGAAQVQGTFIGFGERTGNANLSAIIANLQLKKGCRCVPDIRELTDTAKKIAEIANVALDGAMPFVGKSAFMHKGGMHVDGVLKNPRSFEHIDPESVGNERRFVLSEVAGRKVIVKKLEKYFPSLNDGEVKEILRRIKEQEHYGYQFESAEASFLTVALKTLKLYKPLFELVNFKIINEMPAIEKVSATAVIKIRVLDKTCLSTGEGEGPVNALDLALRKALQSFYPSLADISLVDYKVRVLDGKNATASKVRVFITSTDGKRTWTTVGVSQDIIQASYLALVESMEYKIIADSEQWRDI